MSREKYVFINKTLCTGCGDCTLACSFEKEGLFQPVKSRIHIVEGDLAGFTPQICRNCEDAPCLDACPAGAILRREGSGSIYLDEAKCVECNMCIMVCPFNAISRGEGTNLKCDTCDGETPCVKSCKLGAIVLVDPDKNSKQKRRKMLKMLWQE